MNAGADEGYDPDFLGVRVALPGVPAAVPSRELTYVHFTAVLHVERRLAVLTGVNLDGAQLLDLGRGEDWHLDERVPFDQQTGPEPYARNDLDRGHLVRRRDPVWGSPEVAAAANFDSFSYVNAAPQAAQFNQGEFLWSGLEDYVLGHAQMFGQKLSVFTAPILVADDPPYRGIRIPRRFFKIAAWATLDHELACTGYLLDQTPQLEALDLTDDREAATEIPPLGAFLTFQVPVVDIATLSGLDLGPLPAADRLPTRAPVPAERLTPSLTAPETRWTLLRQFSDVRL